jgi:SAM-dependent methyltransferase
MNKLRGEELKKETIKSCQVCRSEDILVIDKKCEISQCASCGFIFDNPRPSFEEIQVYYSKPTKYNFWLDNLDQREKLWKRRLKRVNKWKKTGILLDIGSGIGQFLNAARNDFKEIYGTEISHSAIKIAKERYGLDILPGSIETIDFSGMKFDNITLFHVLEHVGDPLAMIRKCHFLLNEGGILFIAVPNDIRSFKAKGKEMLRKTGIIRSSSNGIYGLPKIVLDGSVDEIHLSHFTTEVLRSLLLRQGFEILETSMDPYFISTGIHRAFQEVYYRTNGVILAISGHNLYDTIWVVARKGNGDQKSKR